MWENEHKKIVIRNVVILVVLVLVVAGLLTAMLMVKNQIDAEDEQLSAASNSQRQEQSDTRQENLDAIQLAYDTDMQTVAQFVPGVVCWGDSLTTGSSGNVSYPYTLQKYINTYLCDIYDFRSSIENAGDYARLKWDDYKVSIPVINMGAGQENAATILGRAGVLPYVVQSEFTIPSETESVAISFTAPDGSKVSPLVAGGAGMNPVTIEGVKGTLSMVPSSTVWEAYNYLFTRMEAGSEITVPAGSEIIPDVIDQYTDYIHVVWMGTYDNNRSPDVMVGDVKQLLSRQTGNTDRYVVIGPCATNNTWNASITTLDAIDSAMLQAFGSHYINARKYLIEDGLRDAGISPTRDDTLNMKSGVVPASFRSNASGADLNGVAYKLIGKLVYERMNHLGYFDEIRSELYIDKTTQEILKNDPQYFEKMLKAN